MKKAILIAACLFSFTTIVTAQETVSKTKSTSARSLTPEQRAQKQVDAISKEIMLTEDQKPKVYSLALNKVNKIDAIKVKYKSSENNSVRDGEIKAVKKEYHQNVKAILTPEQLEKAKTVQKDKKAAGKESSLEAND